MKDRMLIAVVTILFSTPLFAQQSSTSAAQASTQHTAALEQRIKDLEERLIALEGQVRMLKSGQAQPAAAPQPQPAGAQPAETAAQAPPQIAAPAPTPAPAETQAGIATTGGQLPIYGGASAASKALNPDISVIGDFVGAAGGNSAPSSATLQPFPSLQMHESEVGFQAIIDPYARGDFFISFGEEGVNLEEGYITFTALPAGFVGRVGKMRAAFGKVNTLHNHVLPWTDRPVVTDNLVGGEDGIDDAGFSVTRAFQAPKGIYLEATGQLFRGDSADVFQSLQRRDVSTVAHLRGYKDITESTNVDIGASYSRGHNDFATLPGVSLLPGLQASFLTPRYGVDRT